MTSTHDLPAHLRPFVPVGGEYDARAARQAVSA